MSEEDPGKVSVSSPRGTRRIRAVSLEGFEVRRTSADALRVAGIHDGDSLTEADVHTMIEAAEPEAAMNRALRLLAHRERSTAELASRLAEDGYPVPVVESVTSRLAGYGYLDDARFVLAYVCSKRNSGWGRDRVVRALSEQGVQPEVSDPIVDSQLPETSEVDRACEVIAALDVADRKAYEKGLRRLVSRGYSYEVARAALQRHKQNAQDLGRPRKS